MTKKQKAYKMALIKAVHTSVLYQTIYQNDRDLYVEMLKNNFGVDSSKKLDIDSLKKLVDFLNHKTSSPKVFASKQQVDYMKALWVEKSIQKDGFSLLKFIKRITSKDFNKVEELSKQEATKVIIAIQKIKPLESANNLNYKGKSGK